MIFSTVNTSKICISNDYLGRWQLKLAETDFTVITHFKVLSGVSNLFLKSQHAIPSSSGKGRTCDYWGGGVGVGGLRWDSNSASKWTHPLDKGSRLGRAGTCLTKYTSFLSWISLLPSTHSSIHPSCLSPADISSLPIQTANDIATENKMETRS